MEIEMFSKNRNPKDIRLTARAMLALRVADQALRKVMHSETAGWTHVDIRQMSIEVQPWDFKRKHTAIYLDGIFFGQRSEDHYRGAVFVRMAEENGIWRSTMVNVNCENRVGTQPNDPDPYHWGLKPVTWYISDYESEWLFTRNGSPSDITAIIPVLTTR